MEIYVKKLKLMVVLLRLAQLGASNKHFFFLYRGGDLTHDPGISLQISTKLNKNWLNTIEVVKVSNLEKVFHAVG